jgi:hypothetical protein
MSPRLAKEALGRKGMHEIVRYSPDGCYVATSRRTLSPGVTTHAFTERG